MLAIKTVCVFFVTVDSEKGKTEKTAFHDFVYKITDRGRSRRRKRDFFGTIRRRLNRSKVRSRSMDPGEYDDSMNTDTVNRSISADRARDPSVHSTGNNLILFAFENFGCLFITNA